MQGAIMTVDQTYLTTRGLLQVKEELEHLRTVRRQEVAARIQMAKEVGGTVDNAQYEDAKNDLSYVEGRIQTLESMFQNAVIIPDHKGKASEIIEIGSIVEVQIADAKKKNTYTIVGRTEASPETGLISNESPVGNALLGRKAGETINVQVPAGIQTVRILKVR
jgi:transcription elongation factor GreA